MLRKPLVLTLHGGNLPQFAGRHPQRVSHLFSRAAAITAPSRYLADALQRFRGEIQVIPNPLDLGVYQYRRRDNPRPRLIWLRTFHLIYDPLSAVQVLARITSKFPEAHLTMIGPDKDGSLAKVREEAKRLGVFNQITFTGGVAKAEVPALLSAGDIFLNTATADNSPVSVLEAMASGLDIVSTNVGGMTYLIEDGREGILVPPRDADAMATAVTRLLSEPGLGSRLSVNSRKKAEPHDWKVVLPLWERVFTDACSPKARDG
jgi:glycosyltransferase involved in cell wall biosynthesis